jgi:hypothetical protein
MLFARVEIEMTAEIIEGMGSEDLVTERVARCPTTGNEEKINGET